MYAAPTRRKKKPSISSIRSNWSAAYMSYVEAIRAADGVLLDMTNYDLVQDGIPSIRKGTSQYGVQPLGQVLGMGTFTKSTGVTKPINYEISMQVISGVGKICVRQDGGNWTVIGGAYNASAWTTFTQSNYRVYITNRKNEMSYFNILTWTLISYSAIAAPTIASVVPTGLTGTSVNYRVRVSANNKVGETQASVATIVPVSDYRNTWVPASQYLTITANMVTGADSYNFYIGTSAGNEQYLGNVPAPSSGTTVTFKDNNKAALNPFKVAPEADSTSGPMLGCLISSNAQLFGVDDQNKRHRFWYSGTGDKSGDFSPFNGGGWVDINLGGNSIPIAAKAFRDGKGNSAVTILTRGAAGGGELYHQTFAEQTLGDYTIRYPLIQQANGQAGTYSAMAVVEANNSLTYPTGTAFKTTGTKPQIINVLVTNNVSDTIRDDVRRLNLSAMDKAVGLEYENRIFWCLPVGSTKNSEIWVQDLSRNGVWILRWTIAADFMWLYEDSEGKTHHCMLVNNKILQFDESVGSTDDGVAFRTRLSGKVETFDQSGLQMASIVMKRFALIRPMGKINLNVYGLDDDHTSLAAIANKVINPDATPTGWSDEEWSTAEYSPDFAGIDLVAMAIVPVSIEVGATVCQLSYDITTEGPNCALTLHSESTDGKLIPKLYYGDS